MTTTPRKVTPRQATSARKATAHRGTTTTRAKATSEAPRDEGEFLCEVKLPYLKTTAGTQVYGFPPRSKEFKASKDVPMLYARKEMFQNGRRKTPFRSVTITVVGTK